MFATNKLEELNRQIEALKTERETIERVFTLAGDAVNMLEEVNKDVEKLGEDDKRTWFDKVNSTMAVLGFAVTETDSEPRIKQLEEETNGKGDRIAELENEIATNYTCEIERLKRKCNEMVMREQKLNKDILELTEQNSYLSSENRKLAKLREEDTATPDSPTVEEVESKGKPEIKEDEPDNDSEVEEVKPPITDIEVGDICRVKQDGQFKDFAGSVKRINGAKTLVHLQLVSGIESFPVSDVSLIVKGDKAEEMTTPDKPFNSATLTEFLSNLAKSKKQRDSLTWLDIKKISGGDKSFFNELCLLGGTKKQKEIAQELHREGFARLAVEHLKQNHDLTELDWLPNVLAKQIKEMLGADTPIQLPLTA